MKRQIALLSVSALLIAAYPHRSEATPSTTYWTPATTDIQPYRSLHLGMDNYFTVFRKAEDGAGAFPTDVGLTVGVLPFETLQMEIGVDLLEPSDDPVYFNAKIGTPENALFGGAPALNLGVCNVGADRSATDYDIVYGLIGKTIPGLCRLFAGAYIGNEDLLVDADGDSDEAGVMVGLDRGFLPAQDADGEFNRWVFAADYASGENAFGGGGFGLYYYFTRTISLLTGPVFFNEQAINGEWKWTTQLDVNLPF